MSLFFAGTQDHALLTLIALEAKDLAEVRYLGRTALQKIVYFSKALGVPTRYKFEIYHYGPYSDQIASDIDLLLADDVINDRGQGSTYSNYEPKDAAAIDDLMSRHRVFAERFRPTIKKVVSVFGRLGPVDLELYATLHYAYRYERAGNSRPTREAVVHRFKSYKGDKFPDQQLRSAYDAMVAAGLLTN